MNNSASHTPKPKTILCNGLLFLLPLVALLNQGGVSLCSFLFVLAGLFLLGEVPALMARHGRQIRWVLLAFFINFLCVLASYVLRAAEPLGTLEKPLRMLFCASALLCVLALRPDRKSLWWGLMGGTLAGAVYVSYQRWGLHVDRPGGVINAITFGDLALCMGLLSLAALAAGLVASIATGARGGWLALPVVFPVLFACRPAWRARSVALLGMLVLGLLVGAYLLPQTGVRERVAIGVRDVQGYADGASAFTSIGLRFEMWKAGALLIARHPLAGAGIVSYKAEIRTDVAAGKLGPLILQAEHLHNDALQVLVTGGVAGLLAWAATLLAPLLFFMKFLKRPGQAGPGRAGTPQGGPGPVGSATQATPLALAGVLLVLCYMSFGLTEAIFWSMRASLFYALMIFILMGLCLNAKEPDGK